MKARIQVIARIRGGIYSDGEFMFDRSVGQDVSFPGNLFWREMEPIIQI
jgi:hypothetical protein